MVPIQSDRPMEYSWRSGWCLMLRPSGQRSVTVGLIPPQQLALPLALPVEPAPPLSWWQNVRQFLSEDVFFAHKTPF